MTNRRYDGQIRFINRFGQISIIECPEIFNGAAATANTLTINLPVSADLAKAGFQVGDAVEIDGLTTEPDNNKIAIIREIGSKILIFSDYCFKIPPSDSGDSMTWSNSPTSTARPSTQQCSPRSTR